MRYLLIIVILVCGCNSGKKEGHPFLEAEAELERLAVHVNALTPQVPAASVAPSVAEVQEELSRMVEADQFARKSIAVNRKYSGGEREYFLRKYHAWLGAIDARNTLRMKELLQEGGWFRISIFGAQADYDAWLLVQHATQDIEFQRKILLTLEGLTGEGDTDAANFAYLYDRVATEDGRPQRYGTQGNCSKSGLWAPFDFEDEANVDALRLAVGLGGMDIYKELMYGNCIDLRR